MYDITCLGISNRSDIMNLRTECVTYGCFQPLKEKPERSGPLEFVISKPDMENLLSIGFQIKEIAKLLSVSECSIYRRMRKFGLSKKEFTDIDYVDLMNIVRDILEEFPKCGEVMLHQIVANKGIKVS